MFTASTVMDRCRASFGASEILEAMSSPESAKQLMVRLEDLLKENVANDRVRRGYGSCGFVVASIRADNVSSRSRLY